jgi:hypothetical protein
MLSALALQPYPDGKAGSAVNVTKLVIHFEQLYDDMSFSEKQRLRMQFLDPKSG